MMNTGSFDQRKSSNSSSEDPTDPEISSVIGLSSSEIKGGKGKEKKWLYCFDAWAFVQGVKVFGLISLMWMAQNKRVEYIKLRARNCKFSRFLFRYNLEP